MAENHSLLRSKLKGDSPSILIVGAGYVGLCTGASLAMKGCSVRFLDYNERRVESINKGISPVHEPGVDDILKDGILEGRITAVSSYADSGEFDAVIISVNTPIGNDYSVDSSYLVSAVKSISELKLKGKLIIVRSTVPPGTTRKQVASILQECGYRVGEDLYLSVVPERLSEGKALKDMVNNPIIVGSYNEVSFTLTESLFTRLGVEILRTTPEEAELSKLADNMWIDLNIALANELALVSEKAGADVRNVIRAANTLKKGSSFVNILTPGSGVGGSCLPKDPFILSSYARSMNVSMELPVVSRGVNDRMPGHMFELLESISENIKGSRVGILGLSFNAESGDMRDTPSIPLIRKLVEAGASVFGYDPLISERDIPAIDGFTYITENDGLESFLSKLDSMVIVTAHNVFRDHKERMLKAMGGKAVVDGRYLMSREEAEERQIKYAAVGVGSI